MPLTYWLWLCLLLLNCWRLHQYSYKDQCQIYSMLYNTTPMKTALEAEFRLKKTNSKKKKKNTCLWLILAYLDMNDVCGFQMSKCKSVCESGLLLIHVLLP